MAYKGTDAPSKRAKPRGSIPNIRGGSRAGSVDEIVRGMNTGKSVVDHSVESLNPRPSKYPRNY